MNCRKAVCFLALLMLCMGAQTVEAFDWPKQGERGYLRLEQSIPFPSPAQVAAVAIKDGGKLQALVVISNHRLLRWKSGNRFEFVLGREAGKPDVFLRHAIAEDGAAVAVQLIRAYDRDGWGSAELWEWDSNGDAAIGGVKIEGNRSPVPSPDGQYLHLLPGSFGFDWVPVTVFKNGERKTWEVGDGSTQWPGGNQLGVWFSADASRYAVMTESNGRERITVFSGQGIRQSQVDGTGLVRLSREGKRFALFQSGALSVLSDDGQPVATFDASGLMQPFELQFAEGGESVLAASHSGEVAFFDIRTSTALWKLGPEAVCPSTSTISCSLLAVSGNRTLSRIVVVGQSWQWIVKEYWKGRPVARDREAFEDRLTIVNRKGEILDSITLPANWLASKDALRRTVVISPDGHYLAVAVSAGLGIYSIRR